MSLVAAVDDSNEASTVLAEATRLANDLDEQLHAIHVLKRSELVKILEKDVDGQDITENYEIQRIIENIIDRSVDGDIDGVTTAVRVGDPAEEVSAYAAEINARYIIIGGRQRSPTGKALFGSVTQKVMFESPVPVLNVSIDR